MEDWLGEDHDRKGYYEGFGALMWICISVLFGVAVAVGAVLIHIFC